MQLRVARLCLDCEEVHDQLTCPLCSSESFAYISRWVPAPERQAKPRETSSPQTAEIYRQLLDPNAHKPGTKRGFTRVTLGRGGAPIAEWAWRRMPPANGNEKQQPRQ